MSICCLRSIQYFASDIRGIVGSIPRLFDRSASSSYVNIRYRLSFLEDKRRTFSTTQRNNMRYVQFTSATGGPQRLGVQLTQGGDIIDISGVDSSVPNSLVEFLARGPALLEKTKRIVAEGKSVHSLSDVKLLAPITKPDKVVCVGLNYREHCEEQNRAVPTEPVFFSKFSSVINGPSDDVSNPEDLTKCLDWEVELAIVIGKMGKNIRAANAMDHVFGFTVAQDITARDWQKGHNGGQWLLGKSMDTFCPLGPCVVVKEAIPDPQALALRCWINGDLKQDGNTSTMVFKIDYIVAYLSNFVTLLPGDVILTGTPSGVGVFRKPPQFLKVIDENHDFAKFVDFSSLLPRMEMSLKVKSMESAD